MKLTNIAWRLELPRIFFLNHELKFFRFVCGTILKSKKYVFPICFLLSLVSAQNELYMYWSILFLLSSAWLNPVYDEALVMTSNSLQCFNFSKVHSALFINLDQRCIERTQTSLMAKSGHLLSRKSGTPNGHLKIKQITFLTFQDKL